MQSKAKRLGGFFIFKNNYSKKELGGSDNCLSKPNMMIFLLQQKNLSGFGWMDFKLACLRRVC
jgi:hypothetical protein